MENNIDILNELKGISPLLAGMEKVNVFTVPLGYFEGLGDLLLQVVKENETGILKDLPKQSLLEVPPGYFDNLAENILNRIRSQQDKTASDELRALSPMLYSIQNENVFEVPKGYFAEFSDTILNKVQPHQTRVVAMRRKSSLFIKYAIAAAFTGVMALGVFKFSGGSFNGAGQVLPEYVTDGLKPHNVDDELSKVADEDIIKYLQSNTENFDAQTVAIKTLDENELPSQADYLTDDKALDKYLDDIHVNTLKN